MGRPKGSRNAGSAVNVGESFGRLVVLSVGHDGRYNTASCLCECGTQTTVRQSSLTGGQTASCGCLAKESARQAVMYAQAALLKHGHAKSGKGGHTKVYSTWASVVDRCTNTDSPAYQKYGAKGVRLCERWRASFENFLTDMGEPPTEKHTIDRIDGTGHYEPDNCRWATWKEQAVNRKTTVWVEYGGQRMCLRDASIRAGLNYGTVWSRINDNGWTAERALSTPARAIKKGAS